MILSTTPSIEGRAVRAYLGVVGSEIIFGANFWKDAGAQVTDFIGGRNKDYEQVYADARKKALAELESKATALKASAIVNIRFDYQVLGTSNGMLMVAATGTAVVLASSQVDQAAIAIIEKESAELYHVDIDGRERGPFSIIQLRDLHATGKLSADTLTRTEAGQTGPKIAELLSVV